MVYDGVVQIPCCASGAANIINIDTGSAPWRVMWPTLTYFQPVAVQPPNAGWAAVPSAVWVRPPPAAGSYPQGEYTYQLVFNVPACSQGRTITLSGSFAADNSASLFLDTPTTIATAPFISGPLNTGFQAANVTPFSQVIASAGPGQYRLRATVENNGGASGLILKGFVATNCP